MPRDRRASLLAVPRLPTGLRVAAIAATTDLVLLPARRADPVWNTVGTVTNAHALHAWAKNRQTVQYEATAATTVQLPDPAQYARVPVVRCEATAAMIVVAREAVRRVRVKVAPTAPLMVVTVTMKVLDPVLHVRDRSSLKRANRFLRGTFPECARRASPGGKSPLKQMVPSHDERLSPFFSWRHRFVQYVDCGAHLAG